MPPSCRPQELLTQASAILGQGQLSLAKFLLIVAGEDDPGLDIHDIPAFLRHLLERADWAGRPALPHPDHHRHPGLPGRGGAERRQQAGDRGGRAEAAELATASCWTA